MRLSSSDKYYTMAPLNHSAFLKNMVWRGGLQENFCWNRDWFLIGGRKYFTKMGAWQEKAGENNREGGRDPQKVINLQWPWYNKEAFTKLSWAIQEGFHDLSYLLFLKKLTTFIQEKGYKLIITSYSRMFSWFKILYNMRNGHHNLYFDKNLLFFSLSVIS